MSYPNAARKWREAARHNAEYEARKQSEKAEPLFDYIVRLTKAVEARRPRQRASLGRMARVAVAMGSVGAIAICPREDQQP